MSRKYWVLFGLPLIVFFLTSACNNSPDRSADYWNPDLSVEDRVDDLVGRMTLEEKVSQTLDQAPPIEHLGVPQYNWWNEALHGVARAGLATSFPQAIGVAATWDEPLIYDMATTISDEARAKHHEFVRKESRLRYQGLTIWSPNINLFRDPRWGRGQETYGEDPFLTGRLSRQFITGLQGNSDTYLKTVATVKHFAVHSGPEPERHEFNAVVNERDFHETYLPMFESGIREAGAWSLMCAYNRVFGEAACGSELLLTDILRDQWEFPGYVVSDCWALNDFNENHMITSSATESAAMGLKAGTDLDCGSEIYPLLTDAIEQGLVTEEDLDTAVKRLFTARFKLGMFDPIERVEYAQIPYDIVDSQAHRDLAREVARKSMVLLKNDGILPLSKDLGKIAVIGPNSDQWLMLLGNYNGTPSEIITPLEGVRQAVSSNTEVVYAQGSALAEGFPMFEQIPGELLRTPEGAPGLLAEYFDNRDLDGDVLYSETVSSLDANWSDGVPRNDMDDDNFGVRWTGTLTPGQTGMYEIGTIATMRYEFFLNDSLINRSQYNYRDELGDPRVQATFPMRLEAGETYSLRIEAGESYSDAALQMVWATPKENLQQEALEIASDADAVIMFMGLTPRMEGEEMRVEIDGFNGGDRTDIDLPDVQNELIQQVMELGKPTVLVLLNGSALAINWADEHVPAILEAWYPGQSAGTAIADVLFGDYNPAGRLPVTFYKSVDDLPPFEDYNMEGRSYKYFDSEPLYPFGYGLSYTTFGYDSMTSEDASLSSGESVQVHVNVTNTGDREGEEVAQLYISYPASSVVRPIRELRDFRRVALQAGETQTITFNLDADDLRYWDVDTDQWVLEEAPVEVEVGSSSTDIHQRMRISVE